MGRRILTQGEFIERAREKHGDKYDYSLVAYEGWKYKVSIVCPRHGAWNQRAGEHIDGKGCPRCNNIFLNGARAIRPMLSKDDFIERAKAVHGDRYDYSLVNYKGMAGEINVICPQHGTWKVRAANHVYGTNGCPSCKKSKGENTVAQWLNENGIRYEREKQFDDCRDINPLRFDFYLTDYKVLIEYDGPQHEGPARGMFDKKLWAGIFYHDLLKNRWARENGYILIRIKHDQDVKEVLDSYYQ